MWSLSIRDFIVAGANYFQARWGGEDALKQDLLSQIKNQNSVTAGGRVYGRTSPMYEFVTEEYARSFRSRWYSDEIIDQWLSTVQRNEAGLIAEAMQLSGMEPYVLDRLVVDGDLSKLYEPGGHYVAVRTFGGDYIQTNWAKLGDIVTVRYVEKPEYLGQCFPGSWRVSSGFTAITPQWCRSCSCCLSSFCWAGECPWRSIGEYPV